MKTPLVFAILVALAIASRVIPHESTPNLAAVAAVAMFAGWYFRNRALAIAAPLTAMLVSDALIGGYQPLVMLTVYTSFIVPVFFGRFIGRDRSAAGLLGRAAIGAFAASTLFFLTTNFVVWLASGYYPRTGDGLLACYTAALPFFRFTLAGDLAFSMTLFGGFLALTRVVVPRLATARGTLSN